jgi:hypothetical protein
LQVTKMMRIGLFAAADETRLVGRHNEGAQDYDSAIGVAMTSVPLSIRLG